MKKQILFFAFAILFANFNAIGQEKGAEFGIKAGGNFSKYIGDLHPLQSKYKGVVGFYFGGFAKINLSENFKIQPELLFGLQGSKASLGEIAFREFANEPVTIIDVETKTSESSILIPFVVQYYATENFYFETGPQVGIIINSRTKITNVPSRFEWPDEIETDYDSFDFGITIGAGYKIVDKFNINARYYVGLIERNLSEVKSSVFSLGIEYGL
jgi:hypothetical protein